MLNPVGSNPSTAPGTAPPAVHPETPWAWAAGPGSPSSNRASREPGSSLLGTLGPPGLDAQRQPERTGGRSFSPPALVQLLHPHPKSLLQPIFPRGPEASRQHHGHRDPSLSPGCVALSEWFYSKQTEREITFWVKGAILREVPEEQSPHRAPVPLLQGGTKLC